MLGKKQFIHMEIASLFCALFLSVMLSCAARQEMQPQSQKIIAVLDIVSRNEAVSTMSAKSISDKISQEIRRYKDYIIYERENLPFVLKNLTPQTPLSCSAEDCLSDVGNRIGADQIVGGVIVRKEKKLSIELVRIDVAKNRVIRRISNSIVTKRDDFIARELPALVDQLMKPKGNLKRNAIKVGAAVVIVSGIGGAILVKSKTGPSSGVGDFLLDPPSRSR